MKTPIIVAAYLVAIVLANLSVAWFGPQVTIINAFLFIGLDLSSRDTLHERWHGHGLLARMTALIAAGSILSGLVSIQAIPIAVASFVAFACSATADTVVYAILHERAKLIKMNGSNLVSAAVDSLVFPALAFGFPLLWGVVLGQFLAKLAGGFMWSIILNRQVSSGTRGLDGSEQT